ncbi:MAG: tripartite tricarboxylate transporter substrate binding protein [Hyphomicrobiales bacterium]
MDRRTFLIATSALATMGLPAHAAWTPRRPINVILPYSAGGGTDAFARAVAAAADEVLSVPLIVNNMAGAGGITGAISAAGSRPDGETIMITSAGSFLLTSMLRETEVNPLDNFEIIAQIGDLDPAILVPANSPYQTLADLVEANRANPGNLRWAHNGRGGAHHVAGQSFLNANGLEATDVPFQGGGPTRAAVIGGQVDFATVGIQQAAGFENELRVLALLAPQRDAIASDIPTAVEQGFDYVEVSSPIIAFAPLGTDLALVADMEAAFATITQTTTFAELMLAQGNVPEFLPGAEARSRLEQLKAGTENLITSLRG